MSYDKARWAVISSTLVMLLAGAVMYSHLEKDVTIKDGDKVIEVSTFSETVEDVLAKKNIIIEPEDVVIPTLDTKLENNMQIEIKRAFAVNIISDGKQKVVKTQPDIVENILAKADITLGEKDKVSPDRTTYLNKKHQIEVIRVNEKVTKEVKPIPYKTVSRRDYNLPVGQKKVVQKGEEGKEEIKTIQVIENGKVVSSRTEKKVIKEPKAEIVMTGSVKVASRSGTSFTYSDKRQMEATAYTHTGNRTATGTVARVGVAAVDPKVIPLGTRLYIDGYGFARAEDTGGAIKGDKIDLFFDTLSEVRRFGRRKVTVYILK